MSFLYPSFLFGLAAVAIPIAIHLFNFRRTRKVYFTNVAFLKEVKTTTNSFRRLKHLLILAARILFITFLVLAFAQPFMASKNAAQVNAGEGITSLYLDNSLSMQNESGKRRYLDIATTQADELLGTLPEAPTYHLLTNDFESRDQQLVTRTKLRDRLTEVDFSDTYRPLEAVYRRQQSLLERLSRSASNQVFWISDFQKSTAGSLSALKLDTLTKVFLVPVQTEEANNVYIDSVWLATPFVRERESNQLNVRLVNAGKEKVGSLPIKLFIDEKQVSASSVSLEPNATGTASFTFVLNDRGLKKGRLSFEEFPVTFDNDYYFVINASPVVNIVHLKGPQASPYVAGVYGNETVFNTKTLSALNTDLSQSNVADLVVLDGLNSVDGSVVNQLNDFVRKGGSVLIFPSNITDIGSYATLLNGLGVRGLQKAAPSTPVTPVSTTAAPAAVPPATLAPPDSKNPFFEGIFESTTQKGNMAMPSAQPVLDWANRGDALLQFKNGQPFLSRFEAGKGKVYLCASPLDNNFTSFPRHALFVPVMYKIAALSKTQERMAYSFQESSIAVEVTPTGTEPVYKLNKEDFEVIPAQRLNGNRLVFDLPENPQTATKQLAEAGYYQLTLGDQTQKLLAFNYDRKESQLAVYTPAQLRQLFAGQKNVQVFDSGEEGDFVKEFKNQNLGRNLWKYCLLAALFFLLAEIVIIRVMK